MSHFISIHLKERPKADILPSTFETRNNRALSASDLKDGQVLVKSDYLSLDPAMRGWLNDARSYVPPVKIGECMRGAAISTVIASKSSSFVPGESVMAMCGWTEYAIVSAKSLEKLSLVGQKGIVARDYQSVLGMTSLTAYFGMINVGHVDKLKAGSTVVISGAAGATGLIAGQIAKIHGMKVIGIASSPDKCKFLEANGFDHGISYKSPTFFKDLCKVTPDYVNLFFDNVGGDILDAVLRRAATKSVFVICGAISQYNAGANAKGPAYYTNIIAQRIRMEGFIVFDYLSEYDHARSRLAEWYEAGKLSRQEYIVRGGLTKAPEALQMLFDGKNTGKMLVQVSSDSAKL